MFRKLSNQFIRQLLSFSGAVTGIAILFISFFLFKEGAGLFKASSIEKGYVLVVHSANPVGKLSSHQIKEIFDAEITNWNAVGGKNQEIRIFRIDDIFNEYSNTEIGENYEHLPEKLAKVIQKNEGIIAFLPHQYAPINSPSLKELPTENISFSDYFLGKEYLPTATPAPLF
ncbi:MAG: substrate-binding domain-containing protein, partial [Bacteroidales bacterium]|nr:substrate-binding domain-containing protein [Bacteroidales bacterium]